MDETAVNVRYMVNDVGQAIDRYRDHPGTLPKPSH